MRPRVYIAGPLSAPTCVGYLQNVAAFYRADLALRAAGYAPFNPAADFLVGIQHGAMEYADFFEPDLSWVPAADAILRLPGHSPGADVECALARASGVPVFASIEALQRGLPSCAPPRKGPAGGSPVGPPPSSKE